jgi:HPt (histidine-containing phosphotransfer) domain-containing protein
LPELIETFVEGSNTLVVEMRSAAASSDVPLLGRAAHTLKSNAASFGAARLAALCRDLEASAKEGTVEHACERAEEIAHEQGRAERALLAALSEMTAQA